MRRKPTYVVVAAPVRLDEQFLVARDQPPEQALDDPDPLDTLPPFPDERSVTARQAQQLEQLGAPQRLECEKRVRLFRFRRQRRRPGRSERVVRRLFGRRVLVVRMRRIVRTPVRLLLLLRVRIGRPDRIGVVVAGMAGRATGRRVVINVGAAAVGTVPAPRVIVRTSARRVRRGRIVADCGAAPATAVVPLTPLRVQQPQRVFGVADQEVRPSNNDCGAYTTSACLDETTIARTRTHASRRPLPFPLGAAPLPTRLSQDPFRRDLHPFLPAGRRGPLPPRKSARGGTPRRRTPAWPIQYAAARRFPTPPIR